MHERKLWTGIACVIFIVILPLYAIWRLEVLRIPSGLVAGLVVLGLATYLICWAGRSKYQ